MSTYYMLSTIPGLGNKAVVKIKLLTSWSLHRAEQTNKPKNIYLQVKISAMKKSKCRVTGQEVMQGEGDGT